MHSWIFRNRHELRRIYGLPPEARGARLGLPAAAPTGGPGRGFRRVSQETAEAPGETIRAPLSALPTFVLQPARRTG
jgi:hypothetical protein